MERGTAGWGSGLLGVIIFSGSLPATRVAVADFSPMFLTSARAVIAAEDQRFFEHTGFDMVELTASFAKNQRSAQIERGGSTLLEAVMLGVGDALRADPRVFVFGEDVGGSYGNAFLLLRPLLQEFGDRILTAPLAEGAVLGACVGAALAGQRPIGEM